MQEKLTQTESNRKQSTLLGRIFPWSERSVTTFQKMSVDKAVELVPKKTDNFQSRLQEPIIKNKQEPIVNNKQQHTLSDNKKPTSLFEMWNLIESVGVKRQMLDTAFTTEEAVLELYRVIEKRLHYERERETINRLRAHIEKLKNGTNQLIEVTA